MRKYIICFIAIIFLQEHSFAQDIGADSKNKGVFTYYSPKKYRADFSSKDFSLTIASLQILKAFTIGHDTTVFKRSNYYIQPSIINASELVSLSDFSGFRPGFKFKLGYQTTVDSIKPSSNGWTFSTGWNFFASVDNINLYNTDNSKIEKKYPFSYGVEMNYTQFLPTKWMVLSFTGSLSSGWNDNSLLNFKDISSNTIMNGNIVAFEKFEGKYGKLQTSLNKARLSFSTPITFWHLNPIPYVVLVATENSKPIYFVGLYTNIISKKINFHSFKLPSTFGIGFDKVSKEGEWGKMNVFVRGSINFSEF